jgi:hypothetical protein
MADEGAVSTASLTKVGRVAWGVVVACWSRRAISRRQA